MTCNNIFCYLNRHGMCLALIKNPDCDGRE